MRRSEGAFAPGQAVLRPTSQTLRASSPCRGAFGEEVKLCGMPRPPLGRSNNDDRRQRRKQGEVVGAAASRMQATAQQTLGAATRAVARRRRDGEVQPTRTSRTESKKQQIPKIPSKPIETFFERRVMDFPPSTAQIGYNSRRRGTGIGRAGRGGGTREKEAADLPSAPSRTSLCPAGGTFWRKRSAEHRYDPTRIH